MNNTLTHIYNISPTLIQNIGINLVELKELRMRKSKQFNELLKFLIKTESWTQEEFVEYQEKHLRRMLEYAYRNVPFYHQLYSKNNIDISKIRTIDDLEILPTVKKEDIINNWKSFLSTKKEKYVVRHTSGTTGKPLTVHLSRKLHFLEKTNWMRRDLWSGYNGGWIARFVGDSPVRNCQSYPLYRTSFILNRVFFPTYCLAFNRLPQIIETLKKLNITHIQCYPSAGYLIAKYLQMTDDYLPLRSLLYSSEPLYPFQRIIMEERFKTKLFGYYGQSEEVVSALECEKGHLHLTMIDGILEIMNEKKKVPLGEKGYTIVTSLHNFSMPLIRYELNDYTGYMSKTCECHRSLPIIYPVETFNADFVITPQGKVLSPGILTFPITHSHNIIESQIIQKTIDSIVIKVVAMRDFNEIDERLLLQSFNDLIGDGVNVNIEYVEKIYQTKAFKKRFVINELGRNSLEKIFEQCI